MRKGEVLKMSDLKALKTDDYIHLLYYNDEGERVCNDFLRLNVHKNEELL
jgi:hypothetical protein